MDVILRKTWTLLIYSNFPRIIDTFIAHFESTHPEIPVLRFNGDDFDFVNNEEDLQFILEQVDSTIRKGVSFTMNLREKYGIPKNAVITIAGTVGVGKSTMTQALADALDFKTSFENVDENPYLIVFMMILKNGVSICKYIS